MPTILIIEDEPELVKVLRSYLEQAGFTVLTAQRGDTGLSTWEHKRPDLVILDLNLPGMDGLDVAREIRRKDNTPIIMLTARVEEMDQLIGLELGADDYITKPFSPRIVVARVRALLRRSEAGPSAAQVLRVADLEVDLCLIGGDFRMKTYGAMAPCLRELRRLVPLLPGQAKPLAVLGNHDCIEMLPELEECGLTMLVNDNLPLQRGNEKIWLLGLDDPHYYMVDNVQQACQGVEPGGFTICLAHSPEAYGQAASQGIALYLCGHTHGGQICLPGGVPVITNSRAPRSTAVGRWSWQAMQGYTSRGTGSSSLPVRFNCPPEITLITLRAHEKK